MKAMKARKIHTLHSRLKEAIQSLELLDLDDSATQDIDLDLDEMHATLVEALAALTPAPGEASAAHS